jgi:hypothetical protein
MKKTVKKSSIKKAQRGTSVADKTRVKSPVVKQTKPDPKYGVNYYKVPEFVEKGGERKREYPWDPSGVYRKDSTSGKLKELTKKEEKEELYNTHPEMRPGKPYKKGQANLSYDDVQLRKYNYKTGGKVTKSKVVAKVVKKSAKKK